MEILVAKKFCEYFLIKAQPNICEYRQQVGKKKVKWLKPFHKMLKKLKMSHTKSTTQNPLLCRLNLRPSRKTFLSLTYALPAYA